MERRIGIVILESIKPNISKEYPRKRKGLLQKAKSIDIEQNEEYIS